MTLLLLPQIKCVHAAVKQTSMLVRVNHGTSCVLVFLCQLFYL